MPSSSTLAIAPDPVGILLVTDTSLAVSGGSEQFLRNLTAGLPSDRYKITVVELKCGESGAPSPLLNVVRVPVRAVYGRGGLRAYRLLRKLLTSGNYQIVQSHHEKSDLLNAMLPRRKGVVSISNRRDMGFKKSARLRLAFRYLNHRFHAFVAPAQEILAQLGVAEGVPVERTSWIPNGVDTERFAPRDQQWRFGKRESLGIKSSATVFCCVARMVEVKRHSVLVQAFALARERCPDLHLLLVGDGPTRPALEEQIGQLNVKEMTTLLPSNADVADLLPACDTFVLASASEGMSNALLEAMACGLPAIATAVGGNRELVTAGVNGSLVPPDDVQALADAMVWLATHPERRQTLGAAAREIAVDGYSTSRMVKAYDAFYRRMLAQA